MSSPLFVKKCSLWSLAIATIVLAGCGGSAPPDSRAGRMVYVDVATMKPLVHDVATSFPAVHPATGKPSLQPGLYCAQCLQWYPAPSADQINRLKGAGLCPKHKSPLAADGPWPDDSARPSVSVK